MNVDDLEKLNTAVEFLINEKTFLGTIERLKVEHDPTRLGPCLPADMAGDRQRRLIKLFSWIPYGLGHVTSKHGLIGVKPRLARWERNNKRPHSQARPAGISDTWRVEQAAASSESILSQSQ